MKILFNYYKKYPERFDEKKTGFSTDTIDEMAAHAVLNAKNKASGYRGKKYGKRFLAEAYEALRNKYNIMFDYAFSDETVLKTIVRSNPGLIKIEKGHVTGKWHYNNFDDLIK